MESDFIMKRALRILNTVTNNETSTTTFPVPTTVSDSPMPIQPSLTYETHLALTVTCFVIFLLLFLFVYTQLWMILYYRHKRRSYQTIFLFLCLIWAALRVELFSFYFGEHSTYATKELSDPFLYWLLYSCPVVLQFTTLVLLVSFFSQVVIKAKYPQEVAQYKFRVRVCCSLAVLVFSVVNVVCGVIAQIYRQDPCAYSFRALYVRVGINGFLFISFGIALSYWIFSLNKIANARSLLESKGTNLCQSYLTCFFIVFIFVSRAVYNILALLLPSLLPHYGYGWINVTDQADLVDLYEGYNYAAYSAVLFLWEILPTFIVTVFFRVQKPSTAPVNFDDSDQRSYYRQSGVFDNPERYYKSEANINGSSSSQDDPRYAGPSSSSYNNSHSRLARASSSGVLGVASLHSTNGRQGASYDPQLVSRSSSIGYATYDGT